MRLRQIVIAAADRASTVAELQSFLGVGEGYDDPGIVEFGLHNAVLPIGTDFLEVIAPTSASAPVHGFLGRGGDGGYMAIVQLDGPAEWSAAVARARNAGVRVVWQHDSAEIAGAHLHPKDMGGTLLSVDRATPPESWKWAGPDWQARLLPGARAADIAGCMIGCADPDATRARWAEVLGADPGSVGVTFAEGTGRIDTFRLRAASPDAVGDARVIAGVRIELVA